MRHARHRTASLLLTAILSGCAGGFDDGGADEGAGGNAAPTALASPRPVPMSECKGPWGDVSLDTLYNTPPSGMSAADWQGILARVYLGQAKLEQICRAGKLREVGPTERPAYVTN